MSKDRKKTILLLEDEPILSLSTQLSLEKYNYIVVTALTGLQAIELVNRYPEIDLMLADIDLGKGMDGTEVTQSILLNHDIPVVFLSSHTDPEIVEKTEKITSYGYVVKNSSITVLDASIKMAFKLFEANQRIKNELLERKRAEVALRESETMFKAIFEQANAGIAQINSNTGQFILVNQKYADITGYTREELCNTSFQAITYPDDLEAGLINMKRLISGEIRSFAIEKRYYKKDGNVVWVNLLVSPLWQHGEEPNFHLAVVEEITERVIAEDILRESEKEYRRLIELLPSGVVLHSEGEIILANYASVKFFGAEDINQIVGSPVIERVHPDYRNIVSKRVAIEGQKNVEVPLIHEKLLRLDGTSFDAEVAAMSIIYAGKPSMLALFNDITDRKKAEEKIESLLSEKDIILKEVHHRIKNNMTVIASLLALQAGNTPEKAVAIELEDARSRVQSMMILYDKLYLSTNFRKLSMAQYLPDLVDQIVHNFPNKEIVKIEKHIEDIIVDSKRLSYIGMITNEILTNIMKYAFINRESGLIIVTATTKDNIVYVVIQDDGNGIPEMINLEKSKGFGFTLIKLLTKQLNGHIRIENDNGTKVVLEFMR